jgi:hypothetical protein
MCGSWNGLELVPKPRNPSFDTKVLSRTLKLGLQALSIAARRGRYQAYGFYGWAGSHFTFKAAVTD